MDILVRRRLHPLTKILENKLSLAELLKYTEICPDFHYLTVAHLEREKLKKWNWEILFDSYVIPLSIIEHFQGVLDWNMVLHQNRMSLAFMEKFQRRINWIEEDIYQICSFNVLKNFTNVYDFQWTYFCQHVDIPEYFLRENLENLNWKNVGIYQQLSEKFIEDFEARLNWKSVSSMQRLSTNFIVKHKNLLDWECLCRYQNLDLFVLKMYPKRINWNSVLETQTFSEDELEEFAIHCDWDVIIRTQKVSEDFILKHSDKVNWKLVSTHVQLSERFIETNLYRLDWVEVQKNQTLSKLFLKKYFHMFDLKVLKENNNLPFDFLLKTYSGRGFASIQNAKNYDNAEELESLISPFDESKHFWFIISRLEDLPEDFISKFRDNILWSLIQRTGNYFSEDFIRQNDDYVSWVNVCTLSDLSESFMLEFSDIICWPIVLVNQNVSTDFIQYAVNHFVELVEVLEFYHTLSYLKQLHIFHCSRGEDCEHIKATSLRMNESIKAFVKEGDDYCRYVKVKDYRAQVKNYCIKESKCEAFRIQVKSYISHAYYYYHRRSKQSKKNRF